MDASEFTGDIPEDARVYRGHCFGSGYGCGWGESCCSGWGDGFGSDSDDGSFACTGYGYGCDWSSGSVFGDGSGSGRGTGR